MKQTKKIGIFIAGVLALAMLAGSWAYFSSTSSIKNDLGTESYGGRTVEEFTPDQKLEPGAEVIKTAGVTNTGDYDLVVRIKMDEKWSRNAAQLIAFSSTDPDTAKRAMFNSVARAGTATNYTYDATQTNDTDGQISGDQTVIYKTLDLTNWVAGGDGYWYYTKNLKPGENTGSLLKSLVMADDTDMGKYNTTEYYSTVSKDTIATAQTAYDTAMAAATTPQQKKAAADALDDAYVWQTGTPADVTKVNFKKSESVLDGTLKGYADADYALTITTDLCQATADAVQALWGATPGGVTWTLG